MNPLLRTAAISLLMISLQVSAFTFDGAKDLFKKIAFYITPGTLNPHDIYYDNFHKVTDGVFRSKTMTPASFEKYVTQENIKKVLILREEGFNDYWRIAETAIANKHNVEMVTELLDAKIMPQKDKLFRIHEILKQCKKDNINVLIHCVAGIDRTGQIAGLRLLMEEGMTLETALDQLTLKYGHHEWTHPCCREAIKQLYALKKIHGSLERAIEHYPMNEFNPPAWPIRVCTSVKDVTTDAIQKHPKTSLAIAALGVASAAAYTLQ